MSNPYFAFIQFEVGSFSIDTRKNGAISLQASYQVSGYCTFVLEVYDHTAHELADALQVAAPGTYIIRYGYTNGESVTAIKCSITSIHTELIGQGEIMTLEMVPERLYEQLNPSSGDIHTQAKKYVGRISDIVRNVVNEIGWAPGNIQETVYPLRGENNGNDDLNNPEDYYYWDVDETFIDFVEKLRGFAMTADGKGDFVLNVDYAQDPPVVDFFSNEDAEREAKTLEWVLGDPSTEIISINIDWGGALMTAVGAAGGEVMNQDSITNDVDINAETTGYSPEEIYPVTEYEQVLEPYTGKVLTRKLGCIVGPQGTETFYGGLYPSSWAYTETIRLNPEMQSWPKTVRSDGVVMFGQYVVVAADIDNPAQGHVGRYHRGDIVETSLGTGIVVDYCDRSAHSQNDHFDIAVSKDPKYGWYS